MTTYKTPDGKSTTSWRRYVREWRAFYRPLEVALGVKVLGFDPGVSFVSDGATADIPMWFAKRMRAAIAEAA